VAQPILPFALPLLLCDNYVARERGKVDFQGAFQDIRPSVFPHVHRQFCIVAQLTGGRGAVNTYFEIRDAEAGTLIDVSLPREISFPDRNALARLVHTFHGVRFPRPGLYLIELYCEHTCIADTRLRLRESIA
jgi:Family of unknown function (DUF6941)